MRSEFSNRARDRSALAGVEAVAAALLEREMLSASEIYRVIVKAR